MILQNRDYKLLELIDKFKVINTELAFKAIPEYNNEFILRRRLRLMLHEKLIKRSRTYINERYIYFTKKVQQIRHRLLLLEFYTRLNCEILNFDVEHCLGEETTNLREKGKKYADGLFEIRKPDGKKRVFFAEVHISNNTPSSLLDKYKEVYYSNKYQNVFGVFPFLVIITDQKAPKDETIKTIVIKTDFSNIQEVLK